MKKINKTSYCSVALLLLALLIVGCSNNASEKSKSEASEDVSISQSEEKTDDIGENNQFEEKTDESEPSIESGETEKNKHSSEKTPNNDSNNTSENEENNPLANYSSEEVEYARVWLQLGAVQDVDELNVEHIPAGTPLNPDDETSASYPEDVIQLAGSRLVAGSVTYSGNGDGTINLYNVPLRWDGDYPAGEEFYEDIIENTELVSIDPGNDEEIIELINKIK
ncbi:hypothetical protein SH601_11110 [Gracilibacillus sp. S3-1-1]|uniref:Uncharacterized protein n=1 Tax=Gracilibacillus pellucidus TaxID=3095368 RepID=A0ACC6M6L2_9BACI|nr:hypothetical protein [Gracilibacillus sp. S3-1-1]MDX8046531.1 hypothetical protein [Gracilibacillus sp. S3-1-1]